MHWSFSPPRPTPWRLLAAWWLGLTLLLAAMVGPARAENGVPHEITAFELTRNEDGLHLAFAVDFELPRVVEEALQKGVPLYFVAQAAVFRDRWYWRDKRVSLAERTWRLTFQPLTRKYRVSFGGLNQTYDTLADALVAVRRTSSWRLADAQAMEGTGHYVEFSYRLDTSLLPRPLQIGLGNQADWGLRLDRVQRID
jgi:hypothetical protein